MLFWLSKTVWFLAAPSNALMLLALVGVLAARFRWGRALASVSLVALLALGFGPFGDWALRPLEERFPVPAEGGGPVHGIIVLGGAVKPELTFARGQLSLGDSAERMTTFADLARRHPGARLVFAGGSGALLGEGRAEADAIERSGAELGLDPARIVFERRSRTTAENAAEARALLNPAAGERWLLVTSAFHMPRAVGCFRRVGFPVVAHPVDYRTEPAAAPWSAAGLSSSVAEGLSRFDLAVHEWLGLLAYRLTGRTEDLLPGP